MSYLIAAGLPLLTSYILRINGAEFWNQVIYVIVNSLFVGLAVNFACKLKSYYFCLAVILTLLAPSFYLAGLTNAFAFTVIVVILFLLRIKHEDPFFKSKRGMAFNLILLGVGITTVFLLVWIPYFTHVSLVQLNGLNKLPMSERVISSFKALFLTPNWLYDLASLTRPILYRDDTTIIGPALTAIEKLISLSLKFQLGLFGFFILLAALRKRFLLTGNFVLFVPLLIMVLSYMISPLLNGPLWHEGERIDMIYQFYGFLLFTVFAAVYPIALGFGRKTAAICMINVILFTSLNLTAGVLFLQDTLSYRGNIITAADVPLIYKTQTVQYIAEDWIKTNGGNVVPIDYNLFGIWPWVPSHGEQLNRYYPSVFTIGRSLDYQLERVYGLKNAQEGMQFRSVGQGTYIVCYAHDPTVFSMRPDLTKTEIFGRIKVIKKSLF